MSNTKKATEIIAREVYVSAFTTQWTRAQEHVSLEDKKAYAQDIREGWDKGMVPQIIKFDFGEIALPIVTLLEAEGLIVTDGQAEDSLENWERPSWL